MKQFCMKIDLISLRRENVLFLPSNMAAMASHENALYWPPRNGDLNIFRFLPLICKHEAAFNNILLLQINDVLEVVDEFFNLGPEVKSKYFKKKGTLPHGWDALERQRFGSVSCVLFMRKCSVLAHCSSSSSTLRESFVNQMMSKTMLISGFLWF